MHPIIASIITLCITYLVYFAYTNNLISTPVATIPTTTAPITTPVATAPATTAPTTTSNKDGYFSDWNDWTKCSADCGGGIQTRYRIYNQAKPGGADLPNKADILESKDCNTNPCPVNGDYSSWGEWGPCSKPCGGGVQKRERTYFNALHNGIDIPVGERILKEEKSCNTELCKIDGKMSDWGPWSNCPVQCGGGTITRSRTYIPPQNGGRELTTAEKGAFTETMPCATQPCPTNGKFSDWSSWSSCSKDCGGGTKTRTRTYIPATNNGVDLEVQTPLSESQSCNTQSCLVNGYYSPWSNWSYCSKECGGGTQTRTRTYTPASGGGVNISPLVLSETQNCNTWICVDHSGEVCFDGDSYITLSDGSKKLVKHIEIGDCVKSAVGGNAIIEYIVKTDIEDKLLCNINNMWITPWHPVFVDNEWKYPKDITELKENKCKSIYSLAISNGHAVFINNTIVVTMGHEFKDEIVKHEYFGSKRVIKDLESISDKTGSKIIKNPEIHRCPNTGVIVGMC